MAAQEPSDVVKREGVVTESPCDAAATEETPKVDDVAATESLGDAVASQETPKVDDISVTESSCHAVATPVTPDAGDDVVTESQFQVEALQEVFNVEEDMEIGRVHV